MIVRKTLLAAATAALVSAPAWALPGPAASHPFGPPSTTPNNTNNPGASQRSEAADDAIEEKASDKGEGKGNGGSQGNKRSSHSHSHKCKPHSVAYIASGTLEAGWTLNKNTNGTFSGTVKVDVLHTNHHAAGDKSTKKEYTLENVHLTLVIPDADNDGSAEVDDLKAGDQVMLIGKISALAKKCPKTGSAATPKIRQIVFHPPATS